MRGDWLDFSRTHPEATKRRSAGKNRACPLFFALVLSGCGYRFTAGGADLPGGVQKVCAPIFVNRTAEPGLEVPFTESLRGHLIRAGRLSKSCDATITGEVLNVWGGPTVFTQRGVLASYRIFATVHVRLFQQDKLVAEAQVAGFEDYLPAAEVNLDVLQVEANRQAALRRLSETLARDAYDRLATNW